MRKKIAVALMLVMSSAHAQLDRAGNVLNEDGDTASLPKWALGLMAIGLIGYGLKNDKAPDRNLAIGIGALMLIGLALSH